MIEEIVAEYMRLNPQEEARTAAIRLQLKDPGPLNDRKNFRGHLTGGAFVLSPDKTKFLVIYHKLFNIWVQPGGHWEAEDEGPWVAARREAEEETGVKISKQIIAHGDKSLPFDIESHPILNRPQKKEPAHLHHDFKYVFLAADTSLHIKRKEVNILQAEWMTFDDPRVSHMSITLQKLKKIADNL